MTKISTSRESNRWNIQRVAAYMSLYEAEQTFQTEINAGYAAFLNEGLLFLGTTPEDTNNKQVRERTKDEQDDDDHNEKRRKSL
jgi:hypothetical protein